MLYTDKLKLPETIKENGSRIEPVSEVKYKFDAVFTEPEKVRGFWSVIFSRFWQ
jgi:hypothetical protein